MTDEEKTSIMAFAGFVLIGMAATAIETPEQDVVRAKRAFDIAEAMGAEAKKRGYEACLGTGWRP